MDTLTYDYVGNILEYLDVVDLGRLRAASGRYYYLVEQYRLRRGPEVATASSWVKLTSEQRPASVVTKEAVRKLQAKPNLVLAFQAARSTLEEDLPKHLPADAVVVGACASRIQVNRGIDNVEAHSNSSVMCASFPNARVRPFLFEDEEDEEDHMEQDITDFADSLASTNLGSWKAVIVYAANSQSGLIEKFVSLLQAKLPNVSIVGGICNEGFISKKVRARSDLQKLTVRNLRQEIQALGGHVGANVLEKSELVDLVVRLQGSPKRLSLHHIGSGIFGVALGGDVPVRSVVSRGVQSVTHGIPQATSPYVITNAKLTRPSDEDFVFRRTENVSSIHMIREFLNKETGNTIVPSDMIGGIGREAEFIGIKRPNEDGFELHMIFPYCEPLNAFLVITDGSEAQENTLEGAEIDFFRLDGDASYRDMISTIEKLREQTQGEEILGAVMYSCSGRGPQRGMLMKREMGDASVFADVFPEVPCLGFYAGGEIGPMALAGNQNVFQTGKATVQGFTVVFCLFIVPLVERRHYVLDDSPESVKAFVQVHLSS